jgi:hypothetical protein
MRRLAVALRVASLPIGVVVGLWTASLLVNVSAQVCPPIDGHSLLCDVTVHRFALWLCALFGAVAAVLVTLGSLVMRPVTSN